MLSAKLIISENCCKQAHSLECTREDVNLGTTEGLCACENVITAT